MIQRQLKLRLSNKQETTLTEWLPILTSIWNWSIRKIDMDAQGGIYYTPKRFHNLLAGTSRTLCIPSHTIQGMLSLAYQSWQRCYKKLAKKPRLKGKRNRLNSIPFPDPIGKPKDNKIKVPYLGMVRYHKQVLPEGKIKSGRIIKRASGWYLSLFIDAEPNIIWTVRSDAVGIDPGYKDLLTLSTGEKIDHPKELQKKLRRLGQAQRGGNRELASRIQERIANQRKDRNHKLSRKLVAENATIVFSKDNLQGLSRAGFGKSVASSGHGQLRSMLAYKCSRTGGRKYVEVSGKGSTRICSNCGAGTGPQGRAGLKVRQWVCSACGTHHDRDINAAVNTLMAGVGTTHERRVARNGAFRPESPRFIYGEVQNSNPLGVNLARNVD